MKIHLPWIRVTAAAVLVAGAGIHQAAAQYVPYRPIPQQPAAPAPTAPQQAQAPATQTPYATAYTAYRTPNPATTYAGTPQPTPAYGSVAPNPAYASPTGAQYTQPTAAYPQYPQTGSQYPATYGAYPHVAHQPTPENIPAPNQASPSAAQPSNGAMAAPANGMPADHMNGAAAGACGCNAANYGAGDYYTTPGYGAQAAGGYPNCGVNNYCGDDACNDNQWFAGVYVLGMTRTNSTPVRLTSEIPAGSTYPYYPTGTDTVLTNRDTDYDFRAGLEFRIGSTFTIGDSCNTCQSTGGYNTGCGCNSCAPVTTYAWEVAWWGLDNQPSTDTYVYDTNRLVGMKNFYGLQYDFNGGGNNPVNGYYGYAVPIDAVPGSPGPPDAGYVQIQAQRVRTDFRAQNLELNFIRFPVCNTGCSTSSCGGYDACGCSNYSGCDGGCDDSCGRGFSMYGSCGVRYFRVDDDFMYATEFGIADGAGGFDQTYDGFTYDSSNELFYDIQVDNNLVGPQVGWTTDYCFGKWNLFFNSTFGIFNNRISSTQNVWSGGGDAVTYSDGSSAYVRSNKDTVSFLGELRVGTAYDLSCHWRAVVAYRAVAITGLATSTTQMPSDFSNRYSVGIIDSDNSMIIHGAQVGAECRY